MPCGQLVDDEVACVVLTGTGRAFNVGQDLSEMTDPRHADENRGFRGLDECHDRRGGAADRGGQRSGGRLRCHGACRGATWCWRAPRLVSARRSSASASRPRRVAASPCRRSWVGRRRRTSSRPVIGSRRGRAAPRARLEAHRARRPADRGPGRRRSHCRSTPECAAQRRPACCAPVGPTPWHDAIERENAAFAELAGGPENLAAIEAFFSK